jgi:hypothetical protein
MKQIYLVAAGVEKINGVDVPRSRRMSLTKAEALFDLAHGRLSLAPTRKSRKVKSDGRN